jgi:hypothetical protein
MPAQPHGLLLLLLLLLQLQLLKVLLLQLVQVLLLQLLRLHLLQQPLPLLLPSHWGADEHVLTRKTLESALRYKTLVG